MKKGERKRKREKERKKVEREREGEKKGRKMKKDYPETGRNRLEERRNEIGQKFDRKLKRREGV
jgi:hypothetical protein